MSSTNQGLSLVWLYNKSVGNSSHSTHIKKLASFLLALTIPLLYFLNLVLIWRFQGTISFPSTFVILGLLLATTGVCLWGASFWELRSVFQVLPTANKRIKRGIYKRLKHPMYLGILFTFIGLGLVFQSKQGLLFTAFFILPLLVVRARLEEKKLVD